jgi:hypothetical protein
VLASLAVVGGEAVCEPSEQAEALERWDLYLERGWDPVDENLTCLRCRVRKRRKVEGKGRVGMGGVKLAKSTTTELAGLR